MPTRICFDRIMVEVRLFINDTVYNTHPLKVGVFSSRIGSYAKMWQHRKRVRTSVVLLGINTIGNSVCVSLCVCACVRNYRNPQHMKNAIPGLF